MSAEPCLCGGLDCPRCFPGSYVREVDEDEDDLEAARDRREAAHEDAALSRREWRESERERWADY